jgi:hypothetical protein
MRIGVDPIVRRSVEVQATLFDRRDEHAGSINVVRRRSPIRTTAALNARTSRARCYLDPRSANANVASHRRRQSFQ